MDVTKIGCYTATAGTKWPLCRSHPQELLPQKAAFRSMKWQNKPGPRIGSVTGASVLTEICLQIARNRGKQLSVTADSLLLSLYLLFLVQNCNSNQMGIKEVFFDEHVTLMKGSRSSLCRQEPQTLTDIGIWSFSVSPQRGFFMNGIPCRKGSSCLISASAPGSSTLMEQPPAANPWIFLYLPLNSEIKVSLYINKTEVLSFSTSILLFVAFEFSANVCLVCFNRKVWTSDVILSKAGKAFVNW